ncbi:MAG: hypothetical protein ABDH63_07530 [Candidatus Caldarchaeales archaeon]
MAEDGELRAVRAVVASGLLEAGGRVRAIVVTSMSEGLLKVRGVEVMGGVPEYTDTVKSGPQLPLRSSSVLLVVVLDRGPGGALVDLQEVNRVLEVGGVLVTGPWEDRASAETELLAAGFTVSEARGLEGLTAAVKVWKSYTRERCPKCGGPINIPLIPEDSTAVKIWSFYCTSCGYVWKSEEYALKE